MANNQLITTDLVSNYALAEFANAAPFIMTSNRSYEGDFNGSGYKIGDTLRVRRQNQYLVGDGSVAQPQSIIESVESITINHQYHTMISYTVQDLQLRIEDFGRIFIRPAIQNIVTQMEADIASSAVNELNFFSGSATSTVNSFASVDQAGTKLLSQSVNLSDDAYLALSLKDASALKASLLNQFLPMTNEDIARNTALGHLSYFDIFQSQLIAKHQAGAGPTLHFSDVLTVNGAVSSGNVITLAGATAGVINYFLPGDLIQISGVNSVTPIGRFDTGQNMQFVIQQAASVNDSGAITIVVSPIIISDTGNPLRNVTNPVPNGAVVTVIQSHTVNIAYPMRALDIIVPPLYKLVVPEVYTAVDEETGLSLTITQAGDVPSYQNYMRVDVLCGFKWHQQYASKLISAL
jgi:hypothetical protein